MPFVSRTKLPSLLGSHGDLQSIVVERVHHAAHAGIGPYLSPLTHQPRLRCHRSHRSLGPCARFLIPRPAYQFHSPGDHRPGLGHQSTLEIQASPSTILMGVVEEPQVHQQSLQTPSRSAPYPVPLRANRIPHSDSHLRDGDPPVESG